MKRCRSHGLVQPRNSPGLAGSGTICSSASNPENIFLSHGWMFTWWKHFGKGQLAVIAVRDAGGRLVAVAPFYIARTSAGLGARRLGFLGDKHVGSDYLNVLADAACGLAAVEEIARILFAIATVFGTTSSCGTRRIRR